MEGLPINLIVPVREDDHIRGESAARVTIVEYGDYQCPFCKAAEPLVDALEAALGGQMRLVFRHFPVTSVHPLAELAAKAAESAGLQGKFWEMHRLLFANQSELRSEVLRDYAASLGLDIEQFESGLRSSAIKSHVREDLQGGLRSGVRGTPAFFIDGLRFTGYPNLLGILGQISASHPTLDIAVDTAVGNVGVSDVSHNR